MSTRPAIDRIADTVRFYGLLSNLAACLGGRRRLADCSGRMDWPQRGVYFFCEPGESRSDSGAGYRVVRVGTHALKSGSRSTLWQRLSQHRSSADGGGNHRGSIFRLLVGAACSSGRLSVAVFLGRRPRSWNGGATASAGLACDCERC